MDFRKEYKYLGEKFFELTHDLTMDNWKKIRDKTYWQSDFMNNDLDRLRHKIECIRAWRMKNKIR
jgi:hypothetical protein